MNHFNHLIGIDMAAGLGDEQGGFDKSITLASIDIVGFNPYYVNPNALLISDNNYMNKYVQQIAFMRDVAGLKHVPVIIPEGGTDESYNKCSNYAMDPVDKMTLPFTGIAGYNSWPGYTPFKFTHENDVVTMAPHIYDMWRTTIRVKNHMNGVDVINTLSDTWGAWKHGMQQTYIRFPKWAGITHYTPYLIEQQNYVSSNKSKFVGYVKNRSYNVRTRGCSGVTFPGINPEEVGFFYYPTNFPWNDSRIPSNKRIVITGLQAKQYYKVHWYSFKYGNWLEDYCLKANRNGEIELKYPWLTASNSGSTDNPVMWFTGYRSNCSKNKSALNNDSTIIVEDFINVLEESKIYPNPFEEYFIINSLQDDVFILQSINGKIIGEYYIQKGETNIFSNVAKGMYVGTLLKQNQIFKILKR